MKSLAAPLLFTLALASAGCVTEAPTATPCMSETASLLVTNPGNTLAEIRVTEIATGHQYSGHYALLGVQQTLSSDHRGELLGNQAPASIIKPDAATYEIEAQYVYDGETRAVDTFTVDCQCGQPCTAELPAPPSNPKHAPAAAIHVMVDPIWGTLDAYLDGKYYATIATSVYTSIAVSANQPHQIAFYGTNNHLEATEPRTLTLAPASEASYQFMNDTSVRHP